MAYGHVTNISRDDRLLSEATAEVNGNVPLCKSDKKDGERTEPSDYVY